MLIWSIRSLLLILTGACPINISTSLRQSQQSAHPVPVEQDSAIKKRSYERSQEVIFGRLHFLRGRKGGTPPLKNCVFLDIQLVNRQIGKVRMIHLNLYKFQGSPNAAKLLGVLKTPPPPCTNRVKDLFRTCRDL